MSGELTVVSNGGSVPAKYSDNFMPIFTKDLALERYQAFKDFVKGVLHEGVDFGKVPGSQKDTLLKPGAEKLCTFFGLTPRYIAEVEIEDWDGKHQGQPLFYYRYKCQLYRGDLSMGEGIGSGSTWESKYRWRWVDSDQADKLGFDKSKLVTKRGSVSEFKFAIEKAETSGPYGKPAEYWERFKQEIRGGTAKQIQKPIKSGETREAWEIDTTVYRIPNTDFADQINTVQKMAQKRAYVAATLSATNASDYFTQDVEDYIDIEPTPASSVVSAEASKPNNKPAKPTKPVAANSTVDARVDSTPAPTVATPSAPVDHFQSLIKNIEGAKVEYAKAGWTEEFNKLLLDHEAEDISKITNEGQAEDISGQLRNHYKALLVKARAA